MAKGDVFISAVTNEFGKVRTAIAGDLRKKDLHVRVQDDFRPEPHSETLLRLLHDYIQNCRAVVCIIGKRSGACPQPAEVKHFAHLKILPPEIKQASYTQWELFFARYYKKRYSVYIAKDDYEPDEKAPSGSRLTFESGRGFPRA